MAQQCGPIFIMGTIDDVCFYKMSGKYYARMKSSLTRKRVMKDPAFRRTRANAAMLGEASKMAAAVYRLITGERKKHALYREMTGKALCLLREGKNKEAVFDYLMPQYLHPEPVTEALSVPCKCKEDAGNDKKAYGIVRTNIPLPKLKKPYKKVDTSSQVTKRRKKRCLLRHDWEQQNKPGP